MKPYYKNELTTIYNGDCLDVMDYLIEQGVKVNCVVTSPPYNVSKEYEVKTKIEDYLKFTEKYLTKLYNLMGKESNMLLNVGMFIDENSNNIPLSFMIFPILNKIGFKFRQNIIWRFKGGLSAKHKLSGRYEDIMWIYKGNDTPTFNLDNIRLKEWTRFDKRNNPLGKNPSNVWDIKRVAYGSKEKTEHPCQFPENMIERIVLGFSNKEDLILDLFGGSFTTAKVCEKLGRNNIGIELSKKYCDIGKDRLSKLQMRMDI